MKKIFIVGCPRSGTTLTQAILQQHPDVYTLPETHFMEDLRIIRKRFRFLRVLDYYKLRKSKVVNVYHHLLELGNSNSFIDKSDIHKANTFNKAIQMVDKVLTHLAKQDQKAIWIEKSPEHIFYLHMLEKSIKDAKFIHVIRDGRDVMASIYDASSKYQTTWDGYAQIDDCIRLYNQSIKISKQYINSDNHYLLFYDKMVLNTEEEIEKLYQFLGIKHYTHDFSNFNSANTSIVQPMEHWKMEVTSGIQNRQLIKFKKLFNKIQQQYIEQRLIPLENFYS